MTTLQSIGAGLMLCLPKLKRFGFLLGLCLLFTGSVAFKAHELSSDKKVQKEEGRELIVQQIIIPVSDTTIQTLINDCGEQTSFSSDNFPTGQYADTSARNSIAIICPQDSSKSIQVHFSDFDLEEGDTLLAYDGRGTTAMLLGSGTGTGTDKMNGGWVSSSCGKNINSSGCLTFQFKTDGDNRKGQGWNSWVVCVDNTTALSTPQNQFVTLDCTEFKSRTTIQAAGFSSNCSQVSDSILVQIYNSRGTLCKDTCLRADSSFVIDTLAIGTYTIQYTLKEIPTIKTTSYLVITPPAITCNDEVEAVLGTACMAIIRPDNFLENPCDTSANLYYDIVVKTPEGKVIKTGTSRNSDYPIITKDDISVCSGIKYQVEISRIIDYGGTCCSEGLIKDVCWTNVTFVDGVRPWFTSQPTDTITACEVDFDKIIPDLTRPTVLDNCDSVSLTLKGQELISGDECSDARIYLINWEARDECGLTSTQKDTLRVFRPLIKDFIVPSDTILPCSEDKPEILYDFERLGIVKIALSSDTLALSTGHYICNYILVKNDEIVPHPGGKKITRYWSVVDACKDQPLPVTIDTQIIEFVNMLPPQILCTPHHRQDSARIISLPPNACSMLVTLPKPAATDLCIAPEVEMFSVEQLVDGNWQAIATNLKEAGELTCDTFRVGWQAIDIKKEDPLRDTCFEYFRLVDDTPPKAVCPDEIQIAFDIGKTRLFASEVEHYSTDDCGIAKIEIRRENEAWGEYVDFQCYDVHKTIPVEIRLLDKNGNTNTCGFDVVISDKIPPYCQELSDYNGFCDEFHDDQLGPQTDLNENQAFDDNEWMPLTGALLELYNNRFGTPQCEDNLACVPYIHEQQYQVLYDQCGKVKATRRYRIIDWNGEGIASEWRHQAINLDYKPAWSFTLPVDFYGECGDEMPGPGLIINNATCDLLGWEHKDQVFDVVPDACYKVLRTYHIINWCTYQQGQQPIEIGRDENVLGLVYDSKTVSFSDYGNHGYYTYTQVLKVIDNEAPSISINNVETCIYGSGDDFSGGLEDQTPGESPYECDTIRIFSAEASDCQESHFNNFSFTYEIYEDGTLVGNGDNSKFFWVVRPKVKYTVRFTVYDNCGNEATAEREYEFWDCKRPTVYCIPELNVEIWSDSTARVDAFILNKGSFDNCTAASELRYRVWHKLLSPTPPDTKEGVLSLPEKIKLNCNYTGIQEVYLYVLDEEDNFDFCISNVNVLNNGNVCPDDPTSGRSMVAGNIRTSEGVQVEGVAVEIQGEGIMPDPMLTTSNGTFSYHLNGGQSYQVIPAKNEQPLNGVSTFDLILISKHILGITAFETPYQHIAADVNKSGTITAFDLVQLRRMILNIDSAFSNNQSWRFVDAEFEFVTDQPLNENFQEKIEIESLSSDRMKTDFIAIKIGDLNNNAVANNWQTGTTAKSRSTIRINIEDRYLEKGETVLVDFPADHLSEIQGFQFALQFKGLQLMNITEGVVHMNHIGQKLVDRGVLLTSWDQLDQASKLLSNEHNYFSLQFKATRAGKLSEFLQLQPNFLQTEAYHLTGELLDLTLHFETKESSLELAQNRPNPFREITRIGFKLPVAGEATLTILDLQGRIVQQQQKNFTKGYHEWIIEGKSLNSSGILYYQLATEHETLTRKMMLLE